MPDSGCGGLLCCIVDWLLVTCCCVCFQCVDQVVSLVQRGISLRSETGRSNEPTLHNETTTLPSESNAHQAGNLFDVTKVKK